MNPTIKNSGYILLSGFRQEMSLTNDHSVALWKKFMATYKTTPEHFGNRYISAAEYPNGYFDYFDPTKEFIRWACMETPGNAPDTLETLEIQDGLYAVFIHHGPMALAFKTFDYIFNEWLPKSKYEVDQRPHFEIMPENYSTSDPNATEEIWIPILEKKSGD